MSDETNENASTTNSTYWEQKTLHEKIDTLAHRISAMDHILEERLNEVRTAQHEHTQTLRTVMVGWNAFLKSAEAQLRTVFKGSIPQPILKKLIQTAFKGMDEAERRNK